MATSEVKAFLNFIINVVIKQKRRAMNKILTKIYAIMTNIESKGLFHLKGKQISISLYNFFLFQSKS